MGSASDLSGVSGSLRSSLFLGPRLSVARALAASRFRGFSRGSGFRVWWPQWPFEAVRKLVVRVHRRRDAQKRL